MLTVRVLAKSLPKSLLPFCPCCVLVWRPSSQQHPGQTSRQTQHLLHLGNPSYLFVRFQRFSGKDCATRKDQCIKVRGVAGTCRDKCQSMKWKPKPIEMKDARLMHDWCMADAWLMHGWMAAVTSGAFKLTIKSRASFSCCTSSWFVKHEILKCISPYTCIAEPFWTGLSTHTRPPMASLFHVKQAPQICRKCYDTKTCQDTNCSFSLAIWALISSGHRDSAWVPFWVPIRPSVSRRNRLPCDGTFSSSTLAAFFFLGIMMWRLNIQRHS